MQGILIFEPLLFYLLTRNVISKNLFEFRNCCIGRMAASFMRNESVCMLIDSLYARVKGSKLLLLLLK